MKLLWRVFAALGAFTLGWVATALGLLAWAGRGMNTHPSLKARRHPSRPGVIGSVEKDVWTGDIHQALINGVDSDEDIVLFHRCFMCGDWCCDADTWDEADFEEDE